MNAQWHNGGKVKIFLCLSVSMPVFSPLTFQTTFYYKSWISLCLELILNGPSSFSLCHLLAGRSVCFCWQGVAVCWRGGYGSFDSHTEVWTWLFVQNGGLCQFTSLTFQLLLHICVIYTNSLNFSGLLEFFCLTFLKEERTLEHLLPLHEHAHGCLDVRHNTQGNELLGGGLPEYFFSFHMNLQHLQQTLAQLGGQVVKIHTFFGCCWQNLMLMLIHSLVPHVTLYIAHLLHNIFIYCITRIFNLSHS